MRITLLIAGLLLVADVGAASASAAVPDLIGRSKQEAVQVGTLAGYEVVVGDLFIAPEKWRPDIKPETIYLQTPRAGSPTASGTTIGAWRFVRADASQATATMPDLRGKTHSEARDLLQPLGLPLLAIRSAGDAEQIADQYPRPGRKVLAGTSVYAVTAPSEK